MVRLQRRRSQVGRARLGVLFARLARLNHGVLGEFGQVGRGVRMPQLSKNRFRRMLDAMRLVKPELEVSASPTSRTRVEKRLFLSSAQL